MYKKLVEKFQLLNLPVICYGAGKFGKMALENLRKESFDVEGFCDSDIQKIGTIVMGKMVYSIDDIKERYNNNFAVFITVTEKSLVGDIIKYLKEKNIDSKRIFTVPFNLPENIREFCAQYHVDNMDGYFEGAESEGSLSRYWNNDGLFYSMFKKLDLENVIELACGRGRHVPKYIDKAGLITVVDILDKNIDYCKARFNDKNNISFYKNNGKDLSELKSECYTALFTYDAMVHFESIDVYSYLQETYRVLKKGGRAFFHHSNNTADYKQSFVNSVSGGRSYMSKQMFAHFAYRAGFTILEQQVIDWGVKDLDCLTLVEK